MAAMLANVNELTWDYTYDTVVIGFGVPEPRLRVLPRMLVLKFY